MKRKSKNQRELEKKWLEYEQSISYKRPSMWSGLSGILSIMFFIGFFGVDFPSYNYLLGGLFFLLLHWLTD